ncbi:Protein of unknown function, partial [Gryllus bimaculatus]
MGALGVSRPSDSLVWPYAGKPAAAIAMGGTSRRVSSPGPARPGGAPHNGPCDAMAARSMPLPPRGPRVLAVAVAVACLAVARAAPEARRYRAPAPARNSAPPLHPPADDYGAPSTDYGAPNAPQLRLRRALPRPPVVEALGPTVPAAQRQSSYYARPPT